MSEVSQSNVVELVVKSPRLDDASPLDVLDAELQANYDQLVTCILTDILACVA